MIRKKVEKEFKRKQNQVPDGQQRNLKSTFTLYQDTNNCGKSEQNVLDAEYNCGNCEVVCYEDLGLCCDVCDIYYHIQCEDFPKQIFDFMVSEEAGKQLNWTFSFYE